MKSLKKFLFVVVIAMACGVVSSSAQIIVKIRPPMPHVVRIEAPSPRHVWVGEEWTPRHGHYEFSGGHWVEPPYANAAWIPGHWKRRPGGEFWVPGHWRRHH